MNTILNHLKNQRLLWQGNDYIPFPETQSTGFIEFDQQLNGGFPEQGIVEIDSATGIGELRLLLPFLSNKLQQDQRLIVFIGLPVVLNAEALQQQNISLSQVLVINPNTAKDALWAAEQCLKSALLNTAVRAPNPKTSLIMMMVRQVLRVRVMWRRDIQVSWLRVAVPCKKIGI